MVGEGGRGQVGKSAAGTEKFLSSPYLKTRFVVFRLRRKKGGRRKAKTKKKKKKKISNASSLHRIFARGEVGGMWGEKGGQAKRRIRLTADLTAEIHAKKQTGPQRSSCEAESSGL